MNPPREASAQLALTAAHAFRACHEVLKTNFWHLPTNNPLPEAALVLLLVNLKDGLQLLAKLGHRVDFTDGIPQGDITSLVSDIRNAACHNGSALRLVRGVEFSYGVMEGRGVLGDILGTRLENPYDEEIAYFYGTRRIFLKRHIVRATTEGRRTLYALAKAEGWWLPTF